MSSEDEVDRSFRRLKPQKRLIPLKVRSRSEQAFLDRMNRPFPMFLLDTTVYIDTLHGDVGPDVSEVLRSGELWHSSVTESEMLILAGILNPKHRDTAESVERIIATVRQRASHRILTPSREVWREAGILAGTLARLQQYGKADRRRSLNDALIFLSAAKAGLSVLTRNVADFDLLMQLAPFGRAVFYELEK